MFCLFYGSSSRVTTLFLATAAHGLWHRSCTLTSLLVEYFSVTKIMLMLIDN